MEITSQAFKSQARGALADEQLQQALTRLKTGFIDKRLDAVNRYPDFEALREQGARIKDHTLAHLDSYLERFESRVTEAGGQVHWAPDGTSACRTIVDICRHAEARRVTKSKTMAGEEIALNQALEAADLEVVETDLGEYIIQLAKEPPSHIIAPAVHKTRQQISELFDTYHHRGALKAKLREVSELVTEARKVLREQFLSADVGITGANFLVAETGSVITVTNEGNAELTNTLPRVHIVIAGIEKVVPDLDDADVLLRLLARSATGQAMSAYTTLSSGPRRPDDLDGPTEFHVVLMDNGRSKTLGGEFRQMLRCIRCGACLNHCPVYGAIGGHAYGWVYSGPMGAVLTPLSVGLDKSLDLPNACTLNGRCGAVCPVKIPLPDLLRDLRERQYEQKLTPSATRYGLSAWAFLARRPRLYQWATGLAARALSLVGARRGAFRRLPLAGGWTSVRDFPAPQGRTFMQAWRRQGRR